MPFFVDIHQFLFWISAAYVTIATLMVAVIDIRIQKIRSVFLGWLVFFEFLIFSITALTATESSTLKIIGESLLAGVLFFLMFLVVAIISRGQLGGGDVKFSFFLGTSLGFFGGVEKIFSAFLFIFIFGGLIALFSLLRGNAQKTLPFAPIMSLGAFLALLVTLE